MTSWADLLATPDWHVHLLARVDGVPYTFATGTIYDTTGAAITSYSSGGETYTIWPGAMKVSADGIALSGGSPAGIQGIGSAQSLTIRLIAGDYGATDSVSRMHALLAVDSTAAITHLTDSITASGTTLTVADSSVFSVNDVIYVGQEAMTVSATPTGTTATVARGKYGTLARAYTIDADRTPLRIYASTTIRHWHDRRVRIWLVPVDVMGRYTSTTLEDSGSLEVYAGVVRSITEDGVGYDLQLSGPESLLDRPIARDAAESVVSASPSPTSWVNGESNPWDVYEEAGALYVDESNRYIPVTVKEYMYDTSFPAYGWVLLTAQSLTTEAYLYDADGAAAIVDTVISPSDLRRYLLAGLDRIDWAGTYNFVNDVTFAGNLDIEWGFASQGKKVSDEFAGRVRFHWSGGFTVDSTLYYQYELQFHWSYPGSCGPLMGFTTESELKSWAYLNGSGTPQQPGAPTTSTSDEPFPSLWIPESSTVIPVVVPEYGKPDFASSGYVRVGDSVIPYTGYSALTWYSGQSIDGVKKLTGCGASAFGSPERRPIKFWHNPKYLQEYRNAQTVPTFGDNSEVYAEYSEIKVQQYYAGTAADAGVGILSLCTSTGSANNGAYDTFAAELGGGIDVEWFHTDQIASVAVNQPLGGHPRSYAWAKEQKLNEIIKHECLLIGCQMLAYSAPDSSGTWRYRLGLVPLAEPAKALARVTLTSAAHILPIRPQVTRAGTQSIEVIALKPAFDRATGEIVNNINLTYTFLESQQIGSRSNKLEIRNYGIQLDPIVFGREFLPIAESYYSLYSDYRRRIVLQLASPTAWGLRVGDTVLLTHPYIVDSGAGTLGITDYPVLVTGIWPDYVSDRPDRCRIELTDFRALDRVPYSPTMVVTDITSGVITVANHTYTPAGYPDPLVSGQEATDQSPYQVSGATGLAAAIRIYTVGRWGDATHYLQTTISQWNSATTFEVDDPIPAQIETNLAAGEEVRVDFDLASAAGIVADQLNWAYHTDTDGTFNAGAGHILGA